MENSRKHLLLQLFVILFSTVSVIGTDHIYERVSAHIQDSDYVDPNSLYYNHHSQKVNAPARYAQTAPQNNELVAHEDRPHMSSQDKSYEVFSRRLMNLIILKANFKMDGKMAIGKLDLEATVEELELLKLYGQGKLSIRQIDSILSNVIRAAEISLFDEAFNFTDRVSMYLYQHRIILGSVLVVLLILIMAVKVKWTRFRVILLLFDVMVIVSLMLTWWELLQEAEIKLSAQRSVYYTMPDECKQENISYFTAFLLFLGAGKGDCQKYFEAVMTDPVLKVTPLHAFSHMFSKFVFYPVSLSSHYLSDFVEGMTKDLSWPFNYIVKLVLILFMPVLVGVLLIIYLGGSMGLRVGPFFHIYLHSNNAETPQVKSANITRQAIEIIKADIAETNDPINPTISTAESPKRIKVAPDTKKSISPNIVKEEDNDANNDEFREEKEYEKISKTDLNIEINKKTVGDKENDNLKKESLQDEIKSVGSETEHRVRQRTLEQKTSCLDCE